MQLQLSFPQPDQPITSIKHQDKILLLGSCFTEHIGKKLSEAKFSLYQNPHGILYSPISMANSLKACLDGKTYQQEALFLHHEVWHHWDFHSAFSNISREIALEKMNTSIAHANSFLKEADWLFLTTGSAFQYFFLKEEEAFPVGNCHKVPAGKFKKELLSISRITGIVQEVIAQVRAVNPKLKIIFTVSPVRHIRDGLVENSRSKARLLEATHQLLAVVPNSYYFPAYEMLLDVLRDYRFYENDWVHPSALAVNIIWEQFSKYFFTAATDSLLAEIQNIRQACLHKPLFPERKAHQDFVTQTLEKMNALKKRAPYLDFAAEKLLLKEN